MIEINSKAIIVTINEKLLIQRKPKDQRDYYAMIRDDWFSYRKEIWEIESALVSVNFVTEHIYSNSMA